MLKVGGRYRLPFRPSLFANPTFWMPLSDKGDGEVDLTLTRGQGVATFTRETVATCRMRSGLLKKVAAGVPRSHYLADGTYGGYLSEGQRTNLLLNSEALGSWIVQNGATVTSNAILAPDGTLTADRINGADNFAVAIQQPVIVTPGSVYSYSLFFKAGTATSIDFGFRDPTAGVWACLARYVNGGISVNIGTGTVGMEAWGDGWVRLWLSTTALTNAHHSVYMYVKNTGSITSADNIHAWGAQLELGGYPSSYIPTTGTAATRNADVLTVPISGNASDVEGTAYAELSTINSLCEISAQVAASIEDLAGRLWYITLGDSDTILRTHDGVGVAFTTISSMKDALRKVGVGWKAGESMAICAEGNSPGTAAFDGDMGDGGSSNIGVGCSALGANQWFGTIKDFKIWTKRFSNGHLQDMTS